MCKKVLDKRTGMWFNKHNLIGNRRSGDNVAFSIHRESQVLRMGRKAEQQMDRGGQKEQAIALVFSDVLPPLPGRQCVGIVKVAGKPAIKVVPRISIYSSLAELLCRGHFYF